MTSAAGPPATQASPATRAGRRARTKGRRFESCILKKWWVSLKWYLEGMDFEVSGTRQDLELGKLGFGIRANGLLKEEE